MNRSNNSNICKNFLYFNNIDGFIGKRTNILNSFPFSRYPIVVFQETNLTPFHSSYEDFSLVHRNSKAASYVESSCFIRGCLFVWDPILFSAKIINSSIIDNFDIRAMLFEPTCPGSDLIVISVYRSPSMSRPATASFFDALSDFIATMSNPRILIVGDLNLAKGRKLHHHTDEAFYIDQICSLGFVNLVSGPSRGSIQLDYAFASSDSHTASLIDGFLSDHKAIEISFDVSLVTHTVLPRYVMKTKSTDFKALHDAI